MSKAMKIILILSVLTGLVLAAAILYVSVREMREAELSVATPAAVFPA